MLGKIFFWRKKKKDEEEEDENLEESKPKKKKKRKKKKKEPSKPWGKKERFIVLVVFLITIIASGAASLRSGNFSVPTVSSPGFSISDMNPFKEETIVLYGTQDEEKDPTELINSVIDRTSYLQGDYAFTVTRLDTGFSYGLNQEQIMPAASLVKLPVMAAMFSAEESGDLEFYEEHTLRTSDKVEGSGSLSSRPEGYKVSYEELVRLMGQESDNSAFRISRNLVGVSEIREILRDAEMNNTSIEENVTNAAEIANFYLNLWEGNLIDTDNRDTMLEYLTDTIYEDWISLGVPDSIRVAHKYGTLENVVNDAGIVFSSEPYILVVLSSGVERQEADIVIPEISRMIYEFETS